MTVKCLSGANLPARVKDLNEPPQRLYLTGSIPAGPVVAVVGTRQASSQALIFAEEMSFELAKRGVVVGSGGALGIDSAAHRGALRAGCGTLVVAPASFDRAFPEQNGPLFAQIVANSGGYLSLFRSNVPASRSVFFARNALLVALSSLVVLVEAPPRSGARNAALWSRRLGRPLFVVPSSPWHAAGQGGLLELKLGAAPLLSYKDVLTRLTLMNEHPIEPDKFERASRAGRSPRLPFSSDDS